MPASAHLQENPGNRLGWWRAAVGWALVLLSSLPAAEILEAPPASFDDAAMDETGLIWTSRKSDAGALFTFDGTVWSRVSVDFAREDGSRPVPVALSRFDDGAVACVWRVGGDTLAVSRHLGSDSKMIHQGPGELWTERLPVPPFCDSRNRLWITGNQPTVRWVDGHGNSRVAFEIQEEDLVKREKPASAYNPVMAVEDARGRVWVWSNAAGGGTSYASLDGILLCDGDAVVKQPLKGLEGKMLGPIASLDSQYMIVSVLGKGLYRVDVDTWQADPVGDPIEKAFFIVQNFFRAGSDLYVLVWGRSGGQLWRLRDYTWKRCVQGFALSSSIDRAFLVDGPSFLLASAKNLWLFPEDQEAMELGWATGFPVESVRRMFRRPDGTRFFLGEKSFFSGNYRTEKQRSRVREMVLAKEFRKDAEGSVWCVSATDPGVARRWTGNRWQRFTLPKEFPVEESAEMVPDRQGRIWFLPRSKDGQTMFFDPAAGKGSRFDTVQEAFEEVAANPPEFLEAWPSDPLWRPNRARFAKGRIAFRSGEKTLEYFDGAKWRSWHQRDIVPYTRGMGQPYFDEAGNLCVTIRDQGWKWDGAAWGEMPPDPRHPDYSFLGYDFGPDPVLPEGIMASGNVARDNEGALWYAREGMLYRLQHGVEEAVFDPGEAHPFATGRSPHGVIIDRTGHAFITAGPGQTRWFVVCPRKEGNHSPNATRDGEAAEPGKITAP